MQSSTSDKSKCRRSVPLNTKALAVLYELGTESESDWMFTSCRKGSPRKTTINKVWQRIRKEADLEHIRLHELRHINSRMLINSGHSLYVVQQVLGHSDPSVTQRYSHLSPDTFQAAANSIDSYMDNALTTAASD